jgi:hypothetical protein
MQFAADRNTGLLPIPNRARYRARARYRSSVLLFESRKIEHDNEHD